MALGLYSALATAMLNGTGGGLNDFPYLQLHTGAPGAAGTANIAAESTRFAVTWDTAVAGADQITADVSITTVAATETWVAFTGWSASTGGTPGYSGVVNVGGVLSGADVDIPKESITMVFTLAS